MTDRSNGYEGVAAEFLARRGSGHPNRSAGVGVNLVRRWARTLPRGASVIDLGCGPTFFNRTFDGVLAWGLIFLLSTEDQRQLIHRIADILTPGGRLLFTSPAEPLVWNDAMTRLESRSLGAEEYRRQLSAAGLSLISEYDDGDHGHYFEALKRSMT